MDLLETLRWKDKVGDCRACGLAADEIEKLRAALEEIRGIGEHNDILFGRKIAEFCATALEQTGDRTDGP